MDISATIIMWGDDLIPEQVTSIVGLNPSNTKKRGAEQIYQQNIVRVAGTGMWSFSTRNHLASKSVADHLLFVIAEFRDKIPLLKMAGLVTEIRLSAEAVIGDDEVGISSWEDVFSIDALKALADFGTPISLLVSYPVQHPVARQIGD